MNANELRDKTPGPAPRRTGQSEKRSFNLRFQQATGHWKHCSVCAVKRERARVKTILNEKAAAARE